MGITPRGRSHRSKSRSSPAASKSELRSAIDLIPQLVWSALPDGTIEYCNKSWLEHTGLTLEQAKGWGWTAAIHAEDRDEFIGTWRRILQEGVMGLTETRMRRSDGTFHWFLISMLPQRDKRGHVVRWFGTNTDIEAQKAAEKVLVEAEDRFRQIMDAAPALMWISNTDKLCTYFNKAWLAFTGRPLEAELGNGWAEGVHPEDLKRCMDTYIQAFDRREEFRMEYRLRRNDGEYRWVLDIGVPSYDEDRSFAGYVGTGFDITERKRIEEELRKGEERFRLAAHLGKIFAYDWDTASDVIKLSGTFAQILEVGDEAYTTGQHMLAKVHPDDRKRIDAELAKVSPDHPELLISYRVVRSDGTVIWVERNGRHFFDGNGKLQRILGMVRDITEQKRSEEVVDNMSRRLIEAQEQERLRIARELHDNTNQRLALLAVGIEQIKSDFPFGMSGLHRRLDEIGKNAVEISKEVQCLSHELYSSKLSYLGLVAAMRGFCSEFSEKMNVKITFDARNLPNPVPSDVSLCLFRVLQEALNNAAKHSNSSVFEVKLWGTPDEIHLLITDLGIGFDLDAARKGPGLGLISMQERVRLMKGTLSIETQPGLGTTFQVHAPVHYEASALAKSG
ncbi:MAG TPA: PAS domain S-box protein [Candidatus Acidoferrales bacterium]